VKEEDVLRSIIEIIEVYESSTGISAANKALHGDTARAEQFSA
jgi:hypothetical protein